MPKLPSITLILIGALWLFYAYPVRTANETAAVSDAMQLEADLKGWADNNATKEAVDEIFSDGYSLKLGGETKNRSFRQMIRDTVARSSVPAWPGVLAVVTGAVTLVVSVSQQNRKTEQAGRGDGDKPPN